MKFSEKWLRAWVDPPVSTGELVEQLTMAGLEVDSVEAAGAVTEGLVVGEVLSVEAHPDADKLRLCRVAAGQDEPLQIVCGAPNVRVGGKYPLALIGARLPGGLSIKKSRLRGVESFGMLCSARELGLGDEHQGLLELDPDAATGQGIAELLDLDDHLIDIDLTPNRGDCLGIEGIAREVGTLTRTPVTAVAIDTVAESIADRFAIEVRAADACPRYLGRVLRGIDPHATTPLWMRERLRRSGLRSIDPVVDVTNYVLLELGQPMHAFDLARLAGGICVRYAEAGEALMLLDERRVELDAETLIIADHEKPLAIAGVMGGIDSGIGEHTTDLFLECAWFSPAVIAGRARKYAMQTDSAHRFERGVDYTLQQRAMERATRLLLEIVGGSAGPVDETVSPGELPGRPIITLRRERIRRLLGMLPEATEVADILTRLGMAVAAREEGWVVTPPAFRFDIEREADLIEEIGRVYGYDRLPSLPLTGALEMQREPEAGTGIDRIAELLVDRGYQETITYSFVDPEFQVALNPGMAPIPLSNPISSEMAEMRTSLWPGLLKVVQYNLNRQAGRLRFFEHGLRFFSKDNEIKQNYMIAGVLTGDRYTEHWDGKSPPLDYFDLKGDVEAILSLTGHGPDSRFVRGDHPALHPGQAATVRVQDQHAGWLGRLHPQIAAKYGLNPHTFLFEIGHDAIRVRAPVQFEEISRFPSIRRDLAVVVDAEVEADVLRAEVEALAGELLKEMVVFDFYQGKGIESGRKSIAFGLILQDSSRTLTDEDVETVEARVKGGLRERLGATLRE
ncbi:MAG: phenylalanine--tRNA ligase subunit beta [Gammaproteobacteria bacterium]|jgi:phenylalanyl-tRNA synthetase beta chain